MKVTNKLSIIKGKSPVGVKTACVFSNYLRFFLLCDVKKLFEKSKMVIVHNFLN
jgi:hypothetical protein